MKSSSEKKVVFLSEAAAVTLGSEDSQYHSDGATNHGTKLEFRRYSNFQSHACMCCFVINFNKNDFVT